MNDAGVYKKFYPDSQDIQAASQIIIPTTKCIAFPNAAVALLVILSHLLFFIVLPLLIFSNLCFEDRCKGKRKWHLAKKKA